MARHGENIRKRKDGRWEGRYKAFDENRGKYIYRSVYGRDYGAAKEKLSRARFSLTCHATEGRNTQTEAGCGNQADKARDCGVILFSHAAGEWLMEIFDRRKYSTYIKYDTVYRTHLAGIIGSCQLSSETARELQEKIFDHLSGNGMSESMQKSIICVANQIVAYANRNYSADMPMLERPSAKTKKKSAGIFSGMEQAKLLGQLHEGMDKFMIAVQLCLYAGLRLGEVCALRWTDIDSPGMTLTVNRTVQRIGVSGYQTRTILLEMDPKSESSRRTVPLTAEIFGLLSRLKGDQTYVFGGKKPLDPSIS